MPYYTQNVLPPNFQPPGVVGKALPPGRALGLRRRLQQDRSVSTGVPIAVPGHPAAYPTLLPDLDRFSVQSVAQPRARMIPSYKPSPRVQGAVIYPVAQSGAMPAGTMAGLADYRRYPAESSFAPFALMDIKPGMGNTGYRPVGLRNPALKGLGCACQPGMGAVGDFGEITLPMLGSVDVFTLAVAGGVMWGLGKLMGSFGGKKRGRA